jgi:hypothetical protein
VHFAERDARIGGARRALQGEQDSAAGTDESKEAVERDVVAENSVGLWKP